MQYETITRIHLKGLSTLNLSTWKLYQTASFIVAKNQTRANGEQRTPLWESFRMKSEAIVTHTTMYTSAAQEQTCTVTQWTNKHKLFNTQCTNIHETK